MDEINSIKRALKSQFKMTDLGPCRHYLGMGVTRDRSRGLLYLSFSAYITKVLHQFGLDGCHSVSTSMDREEYLKLERSKTGPDPEILEWCQPAIGALLWITNVRLDISFAVSTMAQFASYPTPAHVSAVKRIFRYLSGTPDYVICYGDSNNPRLYGYVDSDWDGCQQRFRSTTGYIFFKNGGLVSHSSKRQPTVACSSPEAEYTALCQATKEAFGYVFSSLN